MADKKSQLASIKQSQMAKRVTLAEWRAKRLHDMELPSGLWVKLRDVSMTDLLFTGKLPSNILSIVQEQADGGASEIDLNTIMKNTADFNAMLNAVVEVSLVEPRVGTAEDEHHILLAEIPFDDKMAIFNFVNREVGAVRSFREGENQPLAAV